MSNLPAEERGVRIVADEDEDAFGGQDVLLSARDVVHRHGLDAFLPADFVYYGLQQETDFFVALCARSCSSVPARNSLRRWMIVACET